MGIMTKRLIAGEIVNRFQQRDLIIGVLHSGGTASGGNLVNYAAARRAGDHNIRIVSFINGYSNLMRPPANPDHILTNPNMSLLVDRQAARLMRLDQALRMKSARANPSEIPGAQGKKISSLNDLQDSTKTGYLDQVLNVFEALRIGALISIGGDDTMKIANMLMLRKAIREARGERFENFLGVVHVPKTIDNDYSGVPVTFGFFTAAEVIGKLMGDLHADAYANDRWFLAEVMGRKAGFLCAAAAIVGEASLTIVPEDFVGRQKVQLREIVNPCVDAILTRMRQGKGYGTIAVAEGLSDLIEDFPPEALDLAEKDEHGHPRFATIPLEKTLEQAIKKEYQRRTGRAMKLDSKKYGYESRQARASLFDNLLCKTLGVAAVDMILRGEFGNLVSFDFGYEGLFSPKPIAFKDLVDPRNLLVINRIMQGGLYDLVRAMEQPFEQDVDLQKNQG